MRSHLYFALAAVTLAVAGQAQAAVKEGDNQGGSSLLLNVWDDVRSISYTRNLGLILNQFLPSGFATLAADGTEQGTPTIGDKTPDSGLTLSFPGDALFVQTFRDSLPSNVQWNVIAWDQVAIGNQIGNPNNNQMRVITTVLGETNTFNGGMLNITQGANAFLIGLQQVTDIELEGVNSVVHNEVIHDGYAGGGRLGLFLNGGLLGTSASTLDGDPLDFYYLARTTATGSSSLRPEKIQYGNSVNFAKWTLAADGTATYTLSPVPLPPALWLMGSGLVAVLGFARRRKAAAAV